jgi:hypothetical protein
MQQLNSSEGPSVTSPEITEAIKRRDRWMLLLPAAAALAVVLYWSGCITHVTPISLLAFFADFLLAFVIVIMLFAQLLMRNVRATLSALAAVAILAGGFAAWGPIMDLARYVDFAVYRSGYERTVEAMRAKYPAAVPLRVTLKDVDVSAFVVPTIFDYVVYDESDSVGKDPIVSSGDWLCADPGCGSGTMTMFGGEGIIVVRRLSGHFYFVEQTL